jgi:hypothetical protein
MKIELDGKSYRVKRRTSLGNPIGWYVYINDKRYFKSVLTAEEAIKSVLKNIKS